MKGRIFFGIIVAVLATTTFSQEKRFGLGFIIGEPTGISGKMWTTNENAIDAGLAYSFRKNGHLHFHADYLWHFPDALQASERFLLFAGLGGRLTTGRGDGVFGMRVVAGLSWYPYSTPFEVFVEFVPILDLAPATELSGNAGIGVRYLL